MCARVIVDFFLGAYDYDGDLVKI